MADPSTAGPREGRRRAALAAVAFLLGLTPRVGHADGAGDHLVQCGHTTLLELLQQGADVLVRIGVHDRCEDGQGPDARWRRLQEREFRLQARGAGRTRTLLDRHVFDAARQVDAEGICLGPPAFEWCAECGRCEVECPAAAPEVVACVADCGVCEELPEPVPGCLESWIECMDRHREEPFALSVCGGIRELCVPWDEEDEEWARLRDRCDECLARCERMGRRCSGWPCGSCWEDGVCQDCDDDGRAECTFQCVTEHWFEARDPCAPAGRVDYSLDWRRPEAGEPAAWEPTTGQGGIEVAVHGADCRVPDAGPKGATRVPRMPEVHPTRP